MIPDIPPLVNIVLLSLVASLGTGLGGLIAVIRRPGKRMYGLLMGITAGVMICLSFLDLVNEAWSLAGPWTATIGFAIGATFMLSWIILHHTFVFQKEKCEVNNQSIQTYLLDSPILAEEGLAADAGKIKISIYDWSILGSY